MLSRNTFFTILSKFLILLINFVLVVFSTRFWGSEGRGEIALVIANISIITILSNVFCGSTVAYHAPRQERDPLLALALAGAVISSLAGATVFTLIFRTGHFMPMFLIASLISVNTAISTYWLGSKEISKYNLLNLLGPVFILASLMILYFVFRETRINTYFHAYYIGYTILLSAGIGFLAMEKSFKNLIIRQVTIREVISYGIRNEFNYLLQFLNYRLSYYFIVSMLGLSLLGIFSIVVSISEAVWIISRSMSALHFSNVINSDDPLKSRDETIVYARQSFLISVILITIAVTIPDNIYGYIFGEEFVGLRKYILYMSPGVIAIAVTNLYGHYFAGTGRLNILRNKSLIGLLASFIALPLLINSYQLTGACAALDISYILSSLYLMLMFRREVRRKSSD